MKDIQKAPTLKEDVSSELKFFNRRYSESRNRPVQPISILRPWIDRAKNPNPRPLDYWEYMFYLLGDVAGKDVLDLGCGGGWISRLLAFKGAHVWSIDASIEGCISTRKKLREAGFPCDSIAVMDAHSISFRACSFDVVVSNGVLHHLNTAKAADEIHRILKPGGRFICSEPLRYGPLMRALRKVWLKGRGLKEDEKTEHEEAMKDSDFAPFHERFARGLIRKFNFVAKTNRLRNRFGPLAISLRWMDYILLSTIPFLRRYCTGIVCRFERYEGIGPAGGAS